MRDTQSSSAEADRVNVYDSGDDRFLGGGSGWLSFHEERIDSAAHGSALDGVGLMQTWMEKKGRLAV